MNALNDLVSACAVAMAAGAAAGGLRWAALRRTPVDRRHPLWGRDIAAFGFSTALVLLVFGAGRLLLHPRAGVTETIDRGEIVLVAVVLFAVMVVPYRWYFGPVYRDAGWDSRYGFFMSRFTPVMLFAGSLLAVEAANRHGDSGLPAAEPMTVAAPPRSSGLACLVDLEAGSGQRIALPVDGAACGQLAPGATMNVPVRPGLFGARWVATRDVSVPAGP